MPLPSDTPARQHACNLSEGRAMYCDERREFIAKTLIATASLATAALSQAQSPESEPPKNEAPKEIPSWLVVYSAGPNWPKDTPLAQLPLRPHGAYMLELYRRGIMKFAGGFADGSGGAVLFNANDEAAATAIVRDDPAVSTGLFSFVLRRWKLVDWAAVDARSSSVR